MDDDKVTLKDEMEALRTLSVKINNVPPSFWEEFKKDALVNFSNNYIMKIMVDHTRRIQKDARLEELQERIMVLEEKVFNKQADEIVSRVLPTFGRREE